MRKLAKQSFAAAAMALSISTIAVADNDDSRGGKGRGVATGRHVYFRGVWPHYPCCRARAAESHCRMDTL